MLKKSIRDVEVYGKRVLVRVDFNVPLDSKTDAVTDDSRIKATIPTIEYLMDKGARIILCSHLGRPNGKVIENLRMKVVGQRLSQILRQEVALCGESVGPEALIAVDALREGQVLLLENLRFHTDEEKGSDRFARALSQLADIYVNDAFGTSHRAHASLVGVDKYLPAVAGLLLERELDSLGQILDNPPRPFCILTGGAKVSDKVILLNNIMDKVDCIMVGGGMAATFLKAKSYEVGLSLVDETLDTAINIMKKAEMGHVRLLLPNDVLVATTINSDAEVKNVSVDEIPPNTRIVDIGAQTITSYTNVLERCQSVFWNGPMGIYEIPAFAEGTRIMAKIIGRINATTIIGGGSTAEIVTDMKLADKMSFVSTGGGASLLFLSGEKLPGVESLMDKC
jgi:phosphoglycerate kinase